MSRVELFGRTVAWEEAPALAPLARHLLGRLPAAGPGTPVALALVHDAALALPPAGDRLLFVNEGVEVLAGGAGLRVTDGAWQLLVEPDGARIRVAQGPGGARAGELALFIALTVALRHHGWFHLHAAGLVDARGQGVLVVGESGAGKSTVTLSLLEAGLGYLGDDTVFVGAGECGAPEVRGFPRDFHVGERTAAAFPRLAPHLGAPWGAAKRRVDPAAAFPGAARAVAAGVRLLVFPRVTGGARTEAAPREPAEALAELIASSGLLLVDGMPGAPAQFGLLRALVQDARPVELRLGADALEAPARVAEVLGLAAPARCG